MPKPKKCGPTKGRKACKPKACKECQPGVFDDFLQDFTANKTVVLVLMAAALGMGALFSMVLGVSAAGL